MKYEEKIKFAVLLFRARSTNSLAESQKVQTQRRHSKTRSRLALLAPSGGGCSLYLRASDIRRKTRRCFHVKLTDKPALYFSLEGVTASISTSDIIGAAIKK